VSFRYREVGTSPTTGEKQSTDVYGLNGAEVRLTFSDGLDTAVTGTLSLTIAGEDRLPFLSNLEELLTRFRI